MRILFYTSLYPTAKNPVHGVFVRELAREVARLAEVRVVAPENGLRSLLVRPAGTAAPPVEEANVDRCRFWTVPKVFKHLDGRLLAAWSRGAFERAAAFKPDLVHAHYAYPDGAAAARLAAGAGLPLVVTCHGSDIHVLARDPARRGPIAAALGQAAAVIAVSRDLAGRIAALGVDPGRIRHIPNGVDLSRFPLAGKAEARRTLGFAEDDPLLVAVGRLEPVKGYDRLLRALALVSGVRLVLAGDGSLRQTLVRLARELGLSGRVRFAGAVPHEALAPYYQAADILVLSSHSEGWPTVIHEGLACGTPVVAPAVGGIPEALAAPGLGLLLPSAEPATLAEGIRQALARTWDAAALRRAAEAHGWSAVARRYMALYAEVLGLSLSPEKEVSPHVPVAPDPACDPRTASAR
jgi:glycosyltransferase involved in cell wall biosynthesis